MFDVIKGCNKESNCIGIRKVATYGYYNVQCSLQIEEFKKMFKIFNSCTGAAWSTRKIWKARK